MVEMMPGLRTALLDLLFELRDADLRLIIGGGYGLYLKREQVPSAARAPSFVNGPRRGQPMTLIFSCVPNFSSTLCS